MGFDSFADPFTEEEHTEDNSGNSKSQENVSARFIPQKQHFLSDTASVSSTKPSNFSPSDFSGASSKFPSVSRSPHLESKRARSQSPKKSPGLTVEDQFARMGGRQDPVLSLSTSDCFYVVRISGTFEVYSTE